MTTETIYSEIREAFQRLRRRKAVLDVTTGIAVLAAGLAAAWCLVVWIESTVWFGVLGRTAWVVLLILSGLAGFGFLIIRPLILFWLGRLSDRDLAVRIGKTYPDIRDRLHNALEVYEQRERDYSRTSDGLASLAMKLAGKEIRNKGELSVFSDRSRNIALKVLGFVTVLIAASMLSSAWTQAADRMIHFRRASMKPTGFQINVIPGNARIIEGEDVTIQAEIQGRLKDSVFLTWKREREEKIRLTDPYRHRFTDLRKSLDYRIETKEWISSWFRIDVSQRPEIRSLRLKIRQPEYASVPDRTTESGNVDALAGSRVEIDATAQNPLADAKLMFESGRSIPLLVSSEKASGGFVVNADDRYRISLKDTSGITNLPAPYSIRVIPDLQPVVRVAEPGKDLEVDEAMKVGLRIEAEDDYGISLAKLRYWIHRAGDTTAADTADWIFNLNGKSPRRTLIQEVWDLTALDLYPEDVVYYLAEAKDNDRINGPKTARSRNFSIRFPSVVELFQRVEESQSNQIETLQSLKEESERNKEALDKLTDSFKSDGQWNWEKQQTLDDVTGRNQAMESALDSLKSQVDPMMENLERQKLDAEILDQVREIQNLYEQIAPEALKEASKRLQEMLGKTDSEKIEKALESMQFSEEDLRRALDRSLALLKRMQIETELEQIVKQTRDLARDQKTLNESISNHPSRDQTKDQERIGRGTDAVEKEMETLSSHMKALSDMPAEELEKIMSRMWNQRLRENLNSAGQSLQAGQYDEALEFGEEAGQSLSELSEALSAMQDEMNSSKAEKLAGSMMRSQQRLIGISKEQERQNQNPGSDAANQAAILRAAEQAADSLSSLSKQTMILSPELSRSLGRAQNEMRQTIQDEEGSSAGRHGMNALAELNRSVLLLGEARSRLSQKGQGAGSFFGGLDQLAQGQSALRRELESLLASGMDGEKFSQFAAAQEAIRRRLAQMLDQYGERGAGRLSPLLDEMRESAEALRSRRGEESLKRQEKILSRLLESQHALQEQAYDSIRKAKSGTNVSRPSPMDESATPSALAEKLRWDLMRLPEEGYNQEYQALIRRYFEAVLNEAR